MFLYSVSLFVVCHFNWIFIACYQCEHPDLPVIDGLYVIENVKTDLYNDDHVFATIPPGFSIRKSGIPNAGLGVFAETTVPKGTRLGPYDGVIYNSKSSGHNWHYSWIVNYINGGVKHYVDAYPKSRSSWIRYVNCARTVDEENLYIYMYNYDVYYVTYEDIKPGTELLVWYGDGYGETLDLFRTDKDYQRRFNDSEWRFVRKSTLIPRIQPYSSSCFKFYEICPFNNPPGAQISYAKICTMDVQFELCRYFACSKNPCTNKFDCQSCKGYCFHHGRYIKPHHEFVRGDNTNICVCNSDQEIECTSEPIDYNKMCAY